MREPNPRRYTKDDAATAAGVNLCTRAQLLIRAWWNRRQSRRLLELDDDRLNDLGICRMDVLLALRRPVSEDPSATLGVWRDERWAAAQRQQTDTGRSSSALRETKCHSDNQNIDLHDDDMTI